MKSILGKVFRALSAIFSSKSIPPLAVRALRLVTRLAVEDVADASYELFKAIMASDNLTDQYWEASRLTFHGAFQQRADGSAPREPRVGEQILKFLDYHLGLQGAGEDHKSSVALALEAAIVVSSHDSRPLPLAVECFRNFDCTNPSFVRGMRSMIHSSSLPWVGGLVLGLIALVPDQWFNSPIPVMKPEEMSEFCERLAVLMIDNGTHLTYFMGVSVSILFGMLRSPEWRSHIVTRFWSVLSHCALVDEEQESFNWCLQNATH